MRAVQSKADSEPPRLPATVMIEQHTSQQFVKFMKQGKLRAALRLLEQNRGSGVLSLNSTVQVGPMQQSTILES